MSTQFQLRLVAAGFCVLLGSGLATNAVAQAITEAEAAEIAAEGYIYGYPLVLMDISRQVMTHTDKPGLTSAPANQFNVSEAFPDPTFTAVVSPNADTLYSIAWLDLRKEPLVLSLPEMGERYYLMQMLDGWTDVFASPGTRTTGNHAGDYAIVGPNWKDKLPAGVTEIKSPTSMVWILGRSQTNGKADYAAVRAIKSKYKLTPLSAWGTDYAPPAEVPVDSKVDGTTPPVDQANKLDAAEFFNKLAALMVDNPPAVTDAPMIENLKRIGVVAGQPFDAAKLGAAGKGLETGVAKAKAGLLAEGKSLGGVKHVNGWAISLDVGRYGTDYQHRAVIALVGLGANLPEDTVYPMTGVDATGKALTGANQYTLHFAKDQIPPVRAFWSLTMYNARHFFVENPIERYAIGDRDKLQFNEDGSLTLYLQHDSPGPDKEANWLPAPAGEFNLILRLYWPQPQVIDGAWKPPAVTKVNGK